ncbi:hypothetical protein EV421DRAFT_1734742 [Armillaria borealis]|uniref:Uncharacterized protein n=1 Tax=Armillaria borealis TaxID=47425 RepID=A0AA39JMV1_9AGAR|nr:hypothetical protein EV421DRAFT_1734742 [Armillaria borealis]
MGAGGPARRSSDNVEWKKMVEQAISQIRPSYRVSQSHETFLFVGEAASLRKDAYRKEMEAVTGRLARAKEVTSNSEAATAFPNGSWHSGKLEKCLRRSQGHAEPSPAKENQPGVAFARKQQRFDPKYVDDAPVRSKNDVDKP